VSGGRLGGAARALTFPPVQPETSAPAGASRTGAEPPSGRLRRVTESIPPADAELTDFLSRMVPFAASLGIEALSATPEEVRTRLAWHADRCTAGGVLHGGALMALADTTGAWCAFLHLPAGASTTTIESKTNLLRAVRGGHATATARPLHAGRSFIVVDTEVHDDEGGLVARTTQTQAVLSP
jgi:1,4-dihydroxy-2-naphthoyl-CoA hydrolase